MADDGAPAEFDPPRRESISGAASDSDMDIAAAGSGSTGSAPSGSDTSAPGPDEAPPRQARLRDGYRSPLRPADASPAVPDASRRERLRDRGQRDRERDVARDVARGARRPEKSVVERLGERASETPRSKSGVAVATPVAGTPRPEDATSRDVENSAILDESHRRVRRSRLGRRFVQIALLAIVAVFVYYLVSVWQVYSTGRSDEARPVDAIVVMGAAQYDGVASPQLAARLDHVVELWPQGHAEVVVVTGGNQPGDRFTEAETSAAYLIERGVPEAAIVFEDVGTTSYESLERVADLLAVRDFSSVLIVTDPYHALRSRLIAEEVGLTAHVSPTTTSVVTGVSSAQRHAWEAGGVTVGRVTGFDWLNRVMG